MPTSTDIKQLLTTKSWKSVLLWMALFVAVLSLPPGLYFWYLSLEKTDAVFVSEAQFANENFCDFKDEDFYQKHRIQKGQGTFFAHRQFQRHIFNLQGENDTYRKISIWMLDPQVGLYQFKDNNKVKGYFSKGRSGFPAGICGGPIEEGWLRVLSIRKNKIEIELNAEVDCHSLDPNRAQRCANPTVEKRHLMIRQTFHRQALEKITPWIGRAGQAPEEEVHRPVW